MFQLLKKLKLYVKVGPEIVHKYSDQNLFTIILHYQHPQKYFYICNIILNYSLSVKSISGVTLSGNPPGIIKCPYFDTIISHTLKNWKWLKTLCADSANDHVLQSFEVFF